jgi:hypothetical protein
LERCDGVPYWASLQGGYEHLRSRHDVQQYVSGARRNAVLGDAGTDLHGRYERLPRVVGGGFVRQSEILQRGSLHFM